MEGRSGLNTNSVLSATIDRQATTDSLSVNSNSFLIASRNTGNEFLVGCNFGYFVRVKTQEPLGFLFKRLNVVMDDARNRLIVTNHRHNGLSTKAVDNHRMAAVPLADMQDADKTAVILNHHGLDLLVSALWIALIIHVGSQCRWPDVFN